MTDDWKPVGTHDDWAPAQPKTPAATTDWKPIASPKPVAAPSAVTPGLSASDTATLEADADKYGVPKTLARGVQAVEETAGDPSAVSSAGAVGLMQTMPDTFAHYEPHGSLTDPHAQLDAGTQYLRDLWREYHGNVTDVLANYNGGPGAVEYLRKHGTLRGYSASTSNPEGETYDYVRKVTATMDKLQRDADEHAAQVAMAAAKRRASALGSSAGARMSNPALAGMGEPALEPLLRNARSGLGAVGKAASRLGPVTRVEQDIFGSGLVHSADFQGAMGIRALNAEGVRALASHSPQMAADFAALSGVHPSALGLSLPPPRTHVNPVQRFSDYVGGILALPAEKTFSAAMLLGNVADAAWWVPINAMMRDEALRDATGQGSGLSAGLPSPVVPNVGPNTADVRAKLLKALGDPMHAGQVLDALNHQYGFMRNADLQWWSGNPTIRQYIANAKPTTLSGVIAQRTIALHANLADAYQRAPLTTGAITFGGEALNPMWLVATPERAVEAAGLAGRALNSVGRLAMATKAAKAAAKLGGRAIERSFKPETIAKVSDIATSVRAKAQTARNFVREQAPLTSTPYSATMGDSYGFQGVNEATNLEHDGNALRFHTRQMLNRPNLLGSTSIPVRQQIYGQHDTFFNAQRTLYTKSPGGTPSFDPVTGKLSLSLGVIPDLTRPTDYAYATFNPFEDHANTLTIETNAQRGFEHAMLSRTFPAETSAKIEKLLNDKKISEAFSAADVGNEYADFAASADAALKANPPKDARAGSAIVRTMAGERIASSVARKAGFKRVLIQGPRTQLHIVAPDVLPKWNAPNMADVNGVPMFERAANVARMIRDADDSVRSLDVTNAISPRFIDAAWSRQGAWLGANEEQMGTELRARGGGGGPVQPAQGPARSFPSLAEAQAQGLKLNPDWDPATTLEGQLSRSQRFTMLSNWLRNQHTWTKKGGPIEYDTVERAMRKNGELTSFDPAPDPIGFANGADGVVPFRNYLRSVARARTEVAGGGSVLDKAELDRRADNEYTKLAQAAKSAYNTLRPGVAFDADSRLDLSGIAGYGIPEDVLSAVLQADPVYSRMFMTGAAKEDAPIRGSFEADIPNEQDLMAQGAHGEMAKRMVSGFSSLMRLGMLSDPTYHPLVNLATQMFVRSGRADDAFTAFFLPHTIPEEDYARMEQYVRPSIRSVTAPATSSERVAEAFYARGSVDRGKNPWKILSPLTLKQRARVMAGAFKDIEPWHWPQAAVTYLDDAQQALVFSVWEDAFKTLLFKRLEKVHGDPHRAAIETRKALTGTGALTTFEKQLGLNRIVWFYAWGKAMTQFWLNQLYRSPRNIAAPMEAIRTQNENVAPGSESGKPGSQQRAFGLGGPREDRIAFRWGGQVYLTPPLTTPNFIWGSTVADAINVLSPERPLKWVDNFAMNRLSGGYRILANSLKSVSSGDKQPSPQAMFDLANPDKADMVRKGFANVAGNFKPMSGPLTGPLESVGAAVEALATGGDVGSAFRRTSGINRVIPQQRKTQAMYADQALRGAIVSGRLSKERAEHFYAIVEAYENEPDNPKLLNRLVAAAQYLHETSPRP